MGKRVLKKSSSDQSKPKPRPESSRREIKSHLPSFLPPGSGFAGPGPGLAVPPSPAPRAPSPSRMRLGEKRFLLLIKYPRGGGGCFAKSGVCTQKHTLLSLLLQKKIPPKAARNTTPSSLPQISVPGLRLLLPLGHAEEAGDPIQSHLVRRRKCRLPTRRSPAAAEGRAAEGRGGSPGAEGTSSPPPPLHSRRQRLSGRRRGPLPCPSSAGQRRLLLRRLLHGVSRRPATEASGGDRARHSSPLRPPPPLRFAPRRKTRDGDRAWTIPGAAAGLPASPAQQPQPAPPLPALPRRGRGGHRRRARPRRSAPPAEGRAPIGAAACPSGRRGAVPGWALVARGGTAAIERRLGWRRCGQPLRGLVGNLLPPARPRPFSPALHGGAGPSAGEPPPLTAAPPRGAPLWRLPPFEGRGDQCAASSAARVPGLVPGRRSRLRPSRARIGASRAPRWGRVPVGAPPARCRAARGAGRGSVRRIARPVRRGLLPCAAPRTVRAAREAAALSGQPKLTYAARCCHLQGSSEQAQVVSRVSEGPALGCCSAALCAPVFS